MECRNHPGIQAFDRCAGCAEPLCANCLVDIQGQRYCGACKVMLVQGQPPIPQEATRTSGLAVAALILSIVGLLCCGIILCPIGLILGILAKKEIDADRTLRGRGMATAGIVIGVIGFVLYLILFLVRMSQIMGEM